MRLRHQHDLWLDLQSSALSSHPPQKFISILLIGKKHLLAQANMEILFLEKCGNDSDAEHQANFSLSGHGGLGVTAPWG